MTTISLFGQENVNLKILTSDGRVNATIVKTDPMKEIIVGGTYTVQLTCENQTYPSMGEEDIFIAKFNQSGEVLWIKTLGGRFEDQIHDIVIDQQHNIIIAAEYRNTAIIGDTSLSSSNGNSVSFLLEIDQEGNFVNLESFDNGTLNEITQIAIDEEENFYIGGFFEQTLTIGGQTYLAEGITDFYLIKRGKEGKINWVVQEGIEGTSKLISLKILENNDIIIGGTFDGVLEIGENTFTSNTFDKDVFIASLSNTGDFKWSTKAGGVFDDNLIDIDTDSNGNIFAAGDIIGVLSIGDNFQLSSKNGNPDVFWFMLDSTGLPQTGQVLGGTGSEQLNAISIKDDVLFLGIYYQDLWEINAQNLPVGEGVWSTLIEISPQTKNLLNFSLYPSNQNLFLNDFIIRDDILITVGSFKGQSLLSDIEFDAGNSFWAWLEIIRPLSTSNRDINQDKLHKEVVVFPNPVTNYLSFKGEVTIESITIFNLKGERVIDALLLNNQVDVSKLLPGMYTIKAFGKDKFIYSASFIKE